MSSGTVEKLMELAGTRFGVPVSDLKPSDDFFQKLDDKLGQADVEGGILA